MGQELGSRYGRAWIWVWKKKRRALVWWGGGRMMRELTWVSSLQFAPLHS